jgi:thymidylate synthase ThyX
LHVNLIKYPKKEDWIIVKNDALKTVRKETETPPNSEWKTRILTSEHSPIRDLIFMWEWIDIPSWVSVHITRHKFGIEHFVTSQRNDRQNDYDRNKAPQDALVNHKVTANAQAIINVSLKRLCKSASPETRHAWRMFLDEIKWVAPELVALCVKPCIYRNGICSEFKKCGFNKSVAFEILVKEYRKNFEQEETN